MTTAGQISRHSAKDTSELLRQHPPFHQTPQVPLYNASQHCPLPVQTHIPYHVLQRRPLHPPRQRHLRLRPAQPLSPQTARQHRALPKRLRQPQAQAAAAGQGDS